MGRASSSKKVNRAASTGGGRTARGRTPWAWYTGIAAVILAGVLLVTTSRGERQDRIDTTEAPTTNDHWHAAYGVNICGSFQPAISNQRDPVGIHTHADGIIHVHPFTSAAAGRNATLGKFADAAQFTLEPGEIKLPGDKAYKDGDECPDGKEGLLQVEVNGEIVEGDPRDIRLNDRDLITIAFVPEGTDIPEPPSKDGLDNLSDMPGSATTSPEISVVPNDPNAPTTAPGETTSSTAGGADTTAATTATTATTAATSTSAAP